MIRIKSIKAGFRRCGIAHPAEWVEYEDGRFSEAELERLKDEPMLKVEVMAKEPEKAPEQPDNKPDPADAPGKQSEHATAADDQSQSTASTVTADKEPATKKPAAKA